ncbi:desmoplakin-like isoform X1 [Trematomus bernacchii]|uniref:desmoplakin-like isoform X1 n=1 Tax=Trematomus bernacchii TaxID=40690 RepID=UPI00146E663E|nr:desmoplakin-like isoform X1 [Trematomus bernacchii]
MSNYGSQNRLYHGQSSASKGDLTGSYARSGGGNGYDPYQEGYNTYTFSKSSGGGMPSGAMMNGMMSGGTMSNGMVIKGGHSTMMSSSGGGMSGGMGGGMASGMSGGMGGGMASGMASGMSMSGGMGGGMGGGMASGMASGMSMSGGMGGGMASGMAMSGGMGGGMGGGSSTIHQKAVLLQNQCQEYLKKAEYALQSGGSPADVERYMMLAKESIVHMRNCAMDLRQLGQPNDNVVRTLEVCKDQLKVVQMAMTGSLHRRRSTRVSSGGWEEPGRSFQDAIGWIAQRKRLIETAPWGDDPASIEQQVLSHQSFHSANQRSAEVDRAREDLMKNGDKGNLHALDQEWESLQQMSIGRTEQLQELKKIIQDISREIMWVNEREEEELMFDWGDKNIDKYIPKKQEGYSKLMSALEEKEKDLNKLKGTVDTLLKNNHPASDKIEAYSDTLQTQWSWLLQITKCIDTHLKENGAYNQFFKEANETYSKLQKEHEAVRKKFICDKNTTLEDLGEMLNGLEREKEIIMENKRQVQHLVHKSRSIVRLKPRNAEDKSSSQVIVKALCDFKREQKVICKGDEAILNNNSQRSKWDITGPGGLDMSVPSVCLIVPPPNPLSISLANKNEQYYDAIMSIWNQLYINVKSLIAWQYCLIDIRQINSLTMTMLSRMPPEEYRQLIKRMETRFEEFKSCSYGSEMFTDDDKRGLDNQITGAQTHYEELVVQLPAYTGKLEAEDQQNTQYLILIQQQQQQQLLLEQQAAAEAEARRLEELRRREEVKKVKKIEVRVVNKVKKEEVKATKAEVVKKVGKGSSSSSSFSSSRSLSELHTLRLKLEGAEGTLSQHVHICLGDDGIRDCGLKISQLETVQQDVHSMNEEYVRLREQILKELEGMNDPDKAQFLRSEIEIINQRLGVLESSSSAYLQRLQALRDMLESVARAEDIVKVHEARLTEKETTSLTPSEVEDYMSTLKNIKAELDQKKSVLASMEAELSQANHWNGQVGVPFYRCDMMLSKYSEQVGLLTDRWKRIQAQIDTRVQDLQMYHPQLKHYKQTSTSIIDWIDTTRKKQDSLQATKIESIPALTEHITKQKTLNSEIKAKRETVERVLRDNEACVNSIKDYETDLAAYSSGLETLLNIPVKRTMLKSPTMDLNVEATQLQTRYMELLAHSGDYSKFLGVLQKNMEELKIRNTRIDLLEEELRQLRENMQDSHAKNKSLEDAVTRYQLELSNSKDQLLSLEEVKQITTQQCNATKDSLDGYQSQMSDLNDQVIRLQYMLDEEKRKKKLAEERYTTQQEEYELVLRKRQKELETVSWSKVELEKNVSTKEHEIEQLRRQLAEEAARIKELQREMSKVRSQCSTEINNLKLSYESHIHVSRTDIHRLSAKKEEDTADLQLQYNAVEAERRDLEEQLSMLRMSMSKAEEQRQRADIEAHSQRSVAEEEGCRRRDLEIELEQLRSQSDEEMSRYKKELAEVMKRLQEKSDELAYITHSLEEETRRRRTIEEGQVVLEQTLAQLQVKLTSSSVAFTQLGVCEEELLKIRSDLEKESRGRIRVEQNLSKLQGRMKDIQDVRDGLESQVENLRKANQEEVSRRRQVERELENTTSAMTEYVSTLTTLRQSQEHTSMSEKKGEAERLRLQEELERSFKQNKASAERMTQMSAELKALQQQLLQEQARGKEANLRNESLYKTIEEKSKVLNANSVELQRLKVTTETQTKERLKLEEELRATRHDKEELLRSKQGSADELSSQISALELQLKASERSNVDYHNLISELSSEREKIKLETEKIRKQATETKVTMQTIESQYSEIEIERDNLLRKVQSSDKDSDRCRILEEELRLIKSSKDSELRRLQEDNEKVKKDLNYWKDQYESKQDTIRQYDTEKNRMESEKKSLKSEIDRLMRELKELDEKYKSRLSDMEKELRDVVVVRTNMETQLTKARETPAVDPSSLVFDGVRKPVTADQLLDCAVLDQPTFSQLVKGQKTVPGVSDDKKVNLKGTGPIAGVVVEGPKGPGSIIGPLYKMTLTEAKKENLLPPDCVYLLLDAQAATGHIIDPRTNQKFTVEEACAQGVVDEEERERLLAAEGAAVGYRGPGTSKPLSVFQAMKKGLIDKNTTLRLLQAQESVGGILDPVLSVFLPKDKAIERNLINDDIKRALNQEPELYMDPESEDGVTYMSMKKRCKVELHTGLLLLPVPEKVDHSKLVFDGVRKPVTAKHLLDCGVLDKPTFKDLEKGKKTVPEVSDDKKVSLKGTGPIAGVVAGTRGKMSFTEAKKQMLISEDSADLLLEAQAATGHIIDPKTNQKLTVEEACARGVVDIRDRDKLLAAEAAAVGYNHYGTAKPLSVFEAMKKDVIDREAGLRLLQAQESVGGILDPNLSVFLPKDTAIKRRLLDENLRKALNQSPKCYLDPETELEDSYEALKKRCTIEPHTGMLLLPITEKQDPSKLTFDGVRKTVTAQQLLDCGVLDKPTFDQLIKGEKTVPEVSLDKKVFLKGTGSIAGVAAGPMGKMSLSEAKKQMLMPSESADLLLDAQAATGHIIDPLTNQKLTVEEACAQRVVDIRDRDRLLKAEAAAVGYRDPDTAKPLSVFEAMKKGLIDRKTGLRLLQAQESAGGILDPNLSVFLPKDTAIKRNLLDEDLYRALNQSPSCYIDPDTEREASYGSLKKRSKTESHTGLILLPITERKDPSKLTFDGVRKTVTAQQLLDCGVLDKPTFDQLIKGEKTVPEVSLDKKVFLKGTGSIAGVAAGPMGKMSLSEAKKQMLMPSESADLLLDAQAATGHIIDPLTNQKLTVEEACAQRVVDIRDRDRLLKAEAAAVGYRDPDTAKPLSVFEAMKKGLIDRKTGLRLLQAQESAGGILDPNLSVFLPKDTAIKRNLLDEDLYRALNQSPSCYIDPDTEREASYGSLKKRSKTESHTGLILLPITERKDPSKLTFDGVRKTVTAQQLLDCGVLDKPTFDQLIKGEKTVPEVSLDKKVFLKGTGSIAGVAAGPMGKMSLSEAKKQMLMPSESADLLLDAQAATGHIMDPSTNQKLTVEEACAQRVVDIRDRDRLLKAEAAAVGYRDPGTAKPLSVFEAMKKGLIDRKTGLRLLQAQESAGGILDPNLSVFLPKDTAIKRNLLDEDLYQALNQSPSCYIDPDTEREASYGSLKKRSKTESHTGLILLPITERKDPSKLTFDGVRKTVTAQQLLDCGVLDKPTFDQLIKGEKTVPEVSLDKKVFLKGTGSIAGVAAGPMGKMSLSEAKKQMLMPSESADLLLDAQAATGHIMDPSTNQKLTVEEACAQRVVDIRDRDRLLKAEAAAVGYRDPGTAKPLSVFEAMKKGLIDRKTGLRLLQAQESAGGILDPNLSVFLPKDTAIKRNLLDEDLYQALNQSPSCYIDPDTEREASYGSLKKRSKTESHTGLILLPITERKDPSKLMFDGIRKPVSAQQLFECGVLDKPTFNQLVRGEKSVLDVSIEKMVYLKGTGPIAGVVAECERKMSFLDAKKQMLLPPESADLLLEAQAATGYIIDLKTNQKLTVEEACAKGVVDIQNRDRLLVAEAAAVGFKEPRSNKLLSVFEAMKKGLIDKKIGLRLLQAQESAGGIIDPNLSVFLPKDTAIKRNLLDENLRQTLNQSPECYRDPETEQNTSYGSLKEKCMIEPQESLQLLPVSNKCDPSKLLFDGVRKSVTAQQLLDCGILDKSTFNQLIKGEKSVAEVSVDKMVFLKGTGSIAGVAAGPLRKMSFTEAKKQNIMSSNSAGMLLDAQAATGKIIDPQTNQKLTVKEACARGVVDKEDESKLFAAEAAAIGYKDPNSGKLLSAGQAMKKGLIDKDTALRILQAQESVGGILDPALSVFFPKDIAKDRDLIDDDLYQALNKSPKCYLDPDSQQATTYVSLKRKCKADPSTGLLLLPEPKKPITVPGLRGKVSVIDLVDANLLNQSDVEKLGDGRLTCKDIEDRLRSYLKGSTCIAGVYDEATDKVMPVYHAMKAGLLQPGTTLELLEAQAASGFIVDPVNNHYFTVTDAYNKKLFGPEFKDNLLSAERAVTGYKLPGTDKIISLVQAIERGLVEKGHGIRLLDAQIASGGIIDPERSHRVDVKVAYKRGCFTEEMNKTLTDQSGETMGYFDPNTEENITYLELKKRCITDKKTGLILLPIMDKEKLESTLSNRTRKRRVVIVDPETNKEMTVREAYDKGYIDHDTFLELSDQECEWEEITTTAPDGSIELVIIMDKRSGRKYDVTELIEKQIISQSHLDDYRSRKITLTQFADIVTNKTKRGSSSSSSSSSSTSTSSSFKSVAPVTCSTTSSSTLKTSAVSVPLSGKLSSSPSVPPRPLSPTLAKMTTTRTTTFTERSASTSSTARDSSDSLRGISSVSVTLASVAESVGEQEPVGAIFHTDTLEKISITEALNRGLVDSITAQRLLEAQACTGGIIDPTNGRRLSIQEATRQGIINDDMAHKLKPAQKAYFGFEDVKTKKKMSAAQAMKEMWLPYEAGNRFLEFQVATGGVYDPEMGCRRTMEDAIKMGWLTVRAAQNLQDLRNHTKNMNCPKTKLKISYKEALDNCLVEESNGMKMLQASSESSRGISSPYNASSAPGSAAGSRSGSRCGSRRSSVDLGSPLSSSNTFSTSYQSRTTSNTLSPRSTY